MTKNLLIATAILVALSAGGGYVAARMAPTAHDVTQAPDDTSMLGSRKVVALEAENERLSRRVSELESVDPTLTVRRETRRAPEKSAKTATAPAKPKGSAVEDLVDWGAFSKLFASSIDAIHATRGKDWNDIPKDERAKALAVMHSLQMASAEALSKSDAPFFDAQILPGFIDAVFGPSIGFSDKERAALRARARAFLKEKTADLDLQSALPSQIYQARVAIREGVADHLQALTSGENAERLARVSEISKDILAGARETARIGLKVVSGASGPADLVLEQWKQAFQLTDGQVEAARPLAAGLVLTGADALRNRGMTEGAPEPDAETKAAITADFLRLQVEAETAIYVKLSEAQRAALKGKSPRLIEFFDGEGQGSTHQAGGGI